MDLPDNGLRVTFLGKPKNGWMDRVRDQNRRFLLLVR